MLTCDVKHKDDTSAWTHGMAVGDVAGEVAGDADATVGRAWSVWPAQVCEGHSARAMMGMIVPGARWRPREGRASGFTLWAVRSQGQSRDDG